MSTETMDLSIIIPVYNTPEKLLYRCLFHIKNISGIKKEVVLVFDGPDQRFFKDDGLKQMICGEDFSVKICEIPHQGVSAARNYGIANASGEWLLFVDADDYVNEKNICRAFSLMTRNPGYDLVLPNYSMVRNDSPDPHDYAGKKIKRIENDKFIRDVLRPQSGAGFVWGRFIRREWLMKQGVLFNPQLEAAEDAEFMLRIALDYPKILYIPLECYNYCYNPDSAVRRYQKNYAMRYVLGMEQIQYDLKKSNQMEKMKDDYDSCVLYHLLLIAVNDSFHPDREGTGRQKIFAFKKLLQETIFEKSLKNVCLRNFSISRKVALLCIKLHLYRLLQCIAMIRHWQFRH